MATWYSVDIDHEKAQPLLKRIMDAFTPKYVGAGRPLGMAVFTYFNPDTQVVRVFFSPLAISLAIQFGALPYTGEFKDMDLALLVGDPDCIPHLFPDVNRYSAE